MSISVVLVVVAIASLSLTWAVRRYALAASVLDIPNARSSHTQPTPRGGGVAIVLSFLVALPLLAWLAGLGWSAVWAMVGGGGLIALVGFLDDHGHIAARWRLLAHFSGAVWALAWLGGAAPFTVFGATFDLGWIGHGLAVFYLVWLLNLFNFMDGIDGIAGVEAVTTCASGALLYAVLGRSDQALIPLLLAIASAGFLYWNFPPAKIFMGDAGSGFLGLMLGVLSLQAAWVSPPLFWAWLILMAVFIVDATWTLLRRLVRGDKVYEAHRSHAYQYAARLHGRHLPITLAVLLINLGWLLPLALLVATGVLDGLLGFALASAPLIYLAIRYHAGKQE